MSTFTHIAPGMVRHAHESADDRAACEWEHMETMARFAGAFTGKELMA